MPAWDDLDANLKASGISLKWLGNKKAPYDWHIGGFMGGAEGGIITGPVKGMVHVPFKGIWHEPAYGPPRFERKVDARREISTRITLMSSDEFGWFDTENKFWTGMDGEDPGLWSVFTRARGELWCPLQLLDAVETPLENDPTFEGCMQEWDILLAADGEPRWRKPDVRPPVWVNDMSVTTQVKRDENKFSPMVTVGVGRFKLANRSTQPQWPVFTVSAPGRCWLSNGGTLEMIRVPKLAKGQHTTIDTNPEHRIAISDKDPQDSDLKKLIRNSDILSHLFYPFTESAVPVLEQFHGQGFNQPCPPETVSTITVYHDQPGARISVWIPQTFERPW